MNVADTGFLYLSQEDVVAAGGLDMAGTMDAIERAFRVKAGGGVTMPPKVMITWSDEPGTEELHGRIMAMPAYVGGDLDVAGLKWIPSVPDNPRVRGLPRANALVLLSDRETGLPLAVMDGTVVSAMRTGAVTGVAVARLARPGASVVGMLGAGVLAHTQLAALRIALPDLAEVRVYDPDGARCRRFCEHMDGDRVAVVRAASAEAAVRAADVVVTVTMAVSRRSSRPGWSGERPSASCRVWTARSRCTRRPTCWWWTTGSTSRPTMGATPSGWWRPDCFRPTAPVRSNWATWWPGGIRAGATAASSWWSRRSGWAWTTWSPPGECSATRGRPAWARGSSSGPARRSGSSGPVAGASFDPLAARYDEHLAGLRGTIRRELIRRRLGAWLPNRPARAVDVGAGSYGEAVWLAGLGHRVTAIEPFPAQRELAAARLADAPEEVRARIDLIAGDAGSVAGERFDVVLCHGVLPHVPDPGRLLVSVAELAGAGGLVSVVAKNRDALAMRPGLEGRYGDVATALAADRDSGGLGRSSRAHGVQELEAALAARGIAVLDWYGIRVFTDHRQELPAGASLEAAIDAEDAAGRRDPYRRVARLVHLIGSRDRAG
jgi:SAM-dependent methyltransferase